MKSDIISAPKVHGPRPPTTSSLLVNLSPFLLVLRAETGLCSLCVSSFLNVACSYHPQPRESRVS